MWIDKDVNYVNTEVARNLVAVEFYKKWYDKYLISIKILSPAL